jgi:hypothetical protein
VSGRCVDRRSSLPSKERPPSPAIPGAGGLRDANLE